jgi:mRNA interferase MazF
LGDLGPPYGHEQGGQRPLLVVSVDPFNAGLARLAVVLPITSRVRNLPLHIPVAPPEGGWRIPSAILCDAVRSVDQTRLLACWGTISGATKALVEDRLRYLMGL